MALNYQMSETGRAFHESDAQIKMIVGPYGSGKSTICAVDLLTYACSQPPAPDGIRYTHAGVIRATYPELSSMTRRSLLEVLPSEYGTITSAGAPLKGFFLIPLPDKTKVHLEVSLWALQTVDDASKILSANLSFVWINEATGIDPAIFAMVQSRTARFPSLDMGGVNYGGVLLDFNPPSPDNWLYDVVKNPPEGYFVVKQPPAAIKKESDTGKVTYEINSAAENLRNLGSKREGDPTEFGSLEEYEAYLLKKGMRYYKDQVDTHVRNGRTDIVDNMFCLIDTPIIDGKPVFPEFSIKRHVSTEEIEPLPFVDVIIGIDQSGIHPAACLLQQQKGKWVILDEIYAENEGFQMFLHGLLVPLLRSKYATCPVIAAIDPSDKRDDVYAMTTKARLEEIGIIAISELSNSPKLRIQAVASMLNQEYGGILVNKSCELCIRGFSHEYRYRRLRASGTISSAYTPTPEKNSASHLLDSIQYACLLIAKGIYNSHNSAEEFARNLSAERRILRRVI